LFQQGKKSHLSRRLKGKFVGFSANAWIIRTRYRAVKSSLAMLVIGDNHALQ
jgi:hypothetical protein